jgi:hypothetical protein
MHLSLCKFLTAPLGFFFLDKKEPKNQGCKRNAKNLLNEAMENKLPRLLNLKLFISVNNFGHTEFSI